MGMMALFRREVEPQSRAIERADSLPDIFEPIAGGPETGPAQFLCVVVSTDGQAMAWHEISGWRPRFEDGRFCFRCDPMFMEVHRAGVPSMVSVVAVAPNGYPRVISNPTDAVFDDAGWTDVGRSITITDYLLHFDGK